MITIKENKIKIGSLEWYYREILPIKDNHKTPVILLHGLLSQSFCWLEIMPILGEYGYHGIAPDWLGWGLSGKPEQKDFDYTPSSYLKAFTEFIEGLKLEKISLVVQGFLATIGIQYALQYPEKIDKLIILNTPISSSAKLPWQIAQCGVPFLGDMVTQDPLIVDRTLEKGSGFVISDQNLAFYRKPIVTSSLAGRTLVKVVKKLNLKQVITDIETGLKQWEKPCLIIWGKDDPWLEFAPIEELVNSNKKLKLITIEEAKHYPQEHFSKEISPMIVNFLG
ncbi:MAG: alpha/beta fold hydrolase [Cyanobacteria bacterium]|nr:alpha/beta fold hydrolase [Cyanobacteria bacterium CG_2015-22_32_23]NCQ04171.1 alpha/beta fold hydrolase [Cyanobacteria bacterium CG_2015-09_32_10]NCQ40733.1 alpha/beta fold hydrolase [Cyanobacteria bacterium CG_2015-04_32_10]NCS85942.1 alpha/beta fold hydrolase [Cyanobacteria bacterium CG_2015-02_32_10]